MSPRGSGVCIRRPSSHEKSHPEKGAWRASLIKRSNSSSVSIVRALACLITRTGTPSRRGYESGQFWQSSRWLLCGPGCNVPEHWGQISRSLKKGKRSRSAKIPERVRCGVASVFRIGSHRSPPYYLASYWRTLTSLHVRFYHLVRLGTSTLGNRLR